MWDLKIGEGQAILKDAVYEKTLEHLSSLVWLLKIFLVFNRIS